MVYEENARGTLDLVDLYEVLIVALGSKTTTTALMRTRLPAADGVGRRTAISATLGSEFHHGHEATNAPLSQLVRRIVGQPRR